MKISENAKNIIERCLKTFVETAIAYAIPNLAGIDLFNGDNLKTVLVGVGISACATGLSAVWNGIISPLLDSKKEVKFEDIISDDFITEDESEVK